MMPYADMKSNSNEIMQNMGRFLTVAFAATMNLGFADPGFTAAVISK